ncbi:hypothetical protein POX_c04576 [Penicillium oxalicum]|uniref:hypothetical protein n=1 Tax=Penicillium oxalicum TaxID=69781 RepID=UPI0020B66671|nr:hypothetical protein POX_c04576 [Penicillium oxalicum]KAI2791704.1 hypothetical protein POX_c04576 [Penicillium oxalicum]
MDEIADIVRQIGRQQGENAYYRACYALLKRLQELTTHASNELLRLHQFGPLGSEYQLQSAYEVVHELRNSAYELIDEACNAQAACEEFCRVDDRFSANAIFRSAHWPQMTDRGPGFKLQR